MIKFPKYITLAVLLLVCIAFFVVNHILSQNSNPASLWKYQCIDTMKSSRDAARSEVFKKNALAEIAKEVTIIKKLGANCVAIDTPYDEEFVPFLQMWVMQAREEHLHIWFRGNFSSWEGWFNYPKGMTTKEHLQRTNNFILSHADLFQNGDIFTPAMEAENGWGNGYVPPNEYPLFRQFLIDEHTTAQKAFQQIGKNVITNWLSMSGGLAKNMLDEATISSLDDTVTIDHYVNNPEDMKNYVDYFSTKFHARVVIGEFGAPIPDINGTMTDQEQANFVKNIFYILYQEHENVFAVNYWTIKYSSTALVDINGTSKPVSTVLNQYYHPIVITGKITDELGDALDEAKISINNGESTIFTNSYGQYSIVTPVTTVQLLAFKKGYTMQQMTLPLSSKTKIEQNIILKPVHPSLLYEIRLHVKRFFESLIQSPKQKN
ncbi:MAG TPA: carboxypeptidase-like regulatory domain-containing protein [Candidatus Saccharimonadales bacterium]|nr:carboxypeptidase-like regulatory domain-containing protein [Candidatus Saccharimonadales bacterium]